MRTALSVAVAATFGLVPTLMVPSPAQAAPADFLTIADAGNWEGNAITFTATYTGTTAAGFRFATAAGSASASSDYTALPTSTYGVTPATRTPSDIVTNGTTTITSATAQFTSADVGSTIAGVGDFTAGTTIASVTSPTTATLSVAALSSTTAVSGLITGTGTYIEFPASTASAPSTVTVTVITVNDADTTDETFDLRAIPVAPATGPTKSATGTIWALPTTPTTFTVLAPATVPESQSSVAVTATLNAPATHDVTIPVSTTNAASPAATSAGGANRDYTALASTAAIVVPAGQLSGSIAINLWDDNVYEGATQYIRLAFGTPLGASAYAGPTVDIGIVDNDSMPTVSIGNAPAVTEGGSLVFPITLSALAESAVTVQFTTSNGTDTATTHGATGSVNTAGTTATNDFLSVPRLISTTPALPADTGVVTIPAYNLSVNQLVPTRTDTIVEGTETMTATLSAPNSYATLGTAKTATGTITDGSTGPTLTLDTDALTGGLQATFTETDTGDAGKYITLASSAPFAAAQVALQINYSFADVTAVNGVDYRGTSGSFSIPVGATTISQQIPVTIIGDRIYENPDETFNVVLTSPNGTVATTTTPITIVDNGDVQPSWTTGDVTVTEGNSGQTMARVPIRLSGPTNADVTFTTSWPGGATATEGGVSAGTTVGANDFDIPTVPTVTVAAGSTTGYLDIPINGDAIYEHDEAFTVTLATASTNVDSTPSAAVLFTSRVLIKNDDAAPTVTFNQLAGTEGSTIRVTATTAGLSEYDYTLDFTTGATGTNPATANVDYEVETTPLPSYTVLRGSQGALPLPSTLTDIYLSPDDIDEATETFGVTATESTPLLVGVATTTGVYRINDDPADLPPTASISDESIKEGEGSVDVTVSLAFNGDTTSSTQPYTLTYYTVDGSAIAGKDYTETRGTLTIPAGTMSKVINVPIKKDTVGEPAENFYVKIGTPGPAGATLGKYAGEVIISANTGSTEAGAPTLKSLASYRVGAGKATLSGTAAADATVQLWGRNVDSDEGDFAKITETTASSSGAFTFHPALNTHGMYFMAKASGKASAAVKVSVKEDPDIAATSSSKHTVKVTVTGDPKVAGLAARVYRVNASGSLTLVGSGRLTSAGTFSKTLTGLTSGKSYTYKAYIVGDADRGILTSYSSYTRTAKVK